MSADQVALWYLIASICFILALKGLSHPTTARRGNLLGIVGMTIAVLVTLALVFSHTKNVGYILGGIAIGGVIGAVIARRVQMTQMPGVVAAFPSLVGMAAVLIAIAAIHNPSSFGLPVPLPTGNKLELFIGTFIGAITFSGSVIAFGKLSGRISGKPIVFPGQHFLNLAAAIAFLLGFLIIIPIGGADMPVVISMLNSYSGWAAAGIGFSLNNPMLIISGSLVGSSGAILSYIMCRAMNRSFISVILGGFGAAEGAAAVVAEQKAVRSGSPDDAAFIMENAE